MTSGGPPSASEVEEGFRRLQQAAEKLRATLEELPDAMQRADWTTRIGEWLLIEREEVAKVRVVAVKELRPEYSYAAIAARIGRSKSLAAALAREARGADPRYRKKEEKPDRPRRKPIT